MLNIIWPILIILSIIYGIISGNTDNINNAVFQSTSDSITTMMTLLGAMCLWSGIMSVAMNTKLIEGINKMLMPLIRILFPEIKDNEEITKAISMNITANILGIGNAATPFGLKAMELLQEINDNKEELSASMMMLIVINTASLQIIPTTVISIRASLGSTDSTKIIFPIWIATFNAALAGILMTKILIKSTSKRKCHL